MDFKQKKEWLRKYKYYAQEKRRLYYDYKNLCIISLPALEMSGMPSAHNLKGIDDLIIKQREAIDQLNRKIKHCEAEMSKREAAIDLLEDGTEALVLKYRYITGFTWEQIEEEMHYSRQQLTNRYHRAGIEHLEIRPSFLREE